MGAWDEKKSPADCQGAPDAKGGRELRPPDINAFFADVDDLFRGRGIGARPRGRHRGRREGEALGGIVGRHNGSSRKVLVVAQLTKSARRAAH